MAVYNCNVMILDMDPTGEGAAMNAFRYGHKLAVVNDRHVVEGSCTYLDTIPSEAPRHSVRRTIELNTSPMFRQTGEPRWFSFPGVLKSIDRVIFRQVASRTGYYARDRIDMFTGTASLTDERIVEVVAPSDAVERLVADQFMIATGLHPYRPSDINFNHSRVYDSDTVLSLNHTPRRLIIYGVKVIGCEYVSIFSGLGVLVGLIGTHDQPFSFLDDEISDALSYHLRNNNMLIRHDGRYERVKGLDNDAILHLKSGKRIKAGTLLWYNGRTGSTDKLGLENVGTRVNSRGQIEANKNYRTLVSNIFAVGDVIGWPNLASAVYDQGRSTADNIVESDSWRFVGDVSTGIYTTPKIDSIGRNENKLAVTKIPYEVDRASFKGVTRAQTSNEPTGMLKILLRRETLEILGVHCFGDQALEIVHIGQAIMSQPGELNILKYFVSTTFNYPIMAEIYRIAAFDGLNRLF